MLHEVLLGLSGHSSSLLDAVKQRNGSGSRNQDFFATLSLPETELLMSVARVAELHSNLQSRITAISTLHKSTVCRAVATAINSKQLVRFQDHILDVEKRIIAKDSSSVGAYDIVPLASIISEFEQWTRCLQWLWELVLFMNSEDAGSTAVSARQMQCSSAQIIDRLRESLQTGYPDIEENASELTKVAEAAWLRQLATWILYGRLPEDGDGDFCIRRSGTGDDCLVEFNLVLELLPNFVRTETGSSILFIGKSLNQIRVNGRRINQDRGLSMPPELNLLSEHLQILSGVKPPISALHLSRVVTSIRASLSRNTLQELLPLPKILQYLSILQQFFLLGRGEFASTLITEADHSFSNQVRPSFHSGKTEHDTTGFLPKEGEFNAVLARTWVSLWSTVDEDGSNEDMELAQNLMSLASPLVSQQNVSIMNTQTSDLLRNNGNLFKNVLFSAPCVLTMRVPAPFDLFLTKSELDVYSEVNAYLLALRRAQLRLADLWKQTSLRRDHPSPLGPPRSNSEYGQKLLYIRRERRLSRSMKMRKVWATCGAGLFLISEITSYFEGEVVNESWQDLHDWMIGEPGSRPSSSSHRPNSAASRAQSFRPHSSTQDSGGSVTSQAWITSIPAENSAPHDPETISTAHATFLTNLLHGLLLNDAKFPAEVRTLLSNVDMLVAHIIRLQNIQQNLDLEADEGIVDALVDYAKEERQTQLEIDRARKRLDGSMKSVVGRLRELDWERTGRGAGTGFTATTQVPHGTEASAYDGWRGGGIDRLLMKLDFGRGMLDDEQTNTGFV